MITKTSWSTEHLQSLTQIKNHKILFDGYDNTVSCLNMTKQFFENLGYTEFYKNKWWNAPLNFSYSYGLILVSSDKAKIAHIFPTKDSGGNNNHTAGLILYDYKIFMDSYNKRLETIDKKQEDSGF